MKTIRPIAAVCAAAMLLLTACGQGGNQSAKKNDPENLVGGGAVIDYTEEDLPYGSTLVMDSEHTITAQYDRRYVEGGVVDVMIRYYTAIRNKNADEFHAVQFPLFNDFMLNSVLKGEYTDAEIVENTYNGYKSYNNGVDFDFAFLDVTSCQRVTVETVFETYNTPIVGLMDSLAAEKNETPVSERVQDFYRLTVKRYLTNAGSGVRNETDIYLNDEILYVLKDGGSWYIIYS